jgi:hypothetical protein
MRCREAKKLLSDYIEGSLDKRRTESLEAHIAGCKQCTQELSTLRVYQERMASLREAQAPPGFLFGVKSRVRSADQAWPKRGSILSSPRVKVPLELAGVLAVVLIAVVIFRNVAPQREQQVPPPVQETEERRPEISMESGRGEDTDTVEMEKVDFEKKESPPVKDDTDRIREVNASVQQKPETPTAETLVTDIPPSEEEKGERLTAERLATERAEAEEPGLAMEELAEAKRGEWGAPSISKTEDKLLASAPEKPLQRIELALLVFSPAAEETTQEAVSMKRTTSEGTVSPVDADDIEEEYRKKPGSGDPLEAIRNLAAKLGGMVLSFDYEQEQDIPRYVTVQIPRERYKEFIDGVKALGELEKAAPALPLDETGQVVLRVELVL